MARLPIPDKPELYQKTTGFFCISFATVNKRGRRALGAQVLNTRDKKTAKEAFDEWVNGGGLAQRLEADKQAAEAAKSRQVPVVVPEPRVKRQYRHNGAAAAHKERERQRSQLRSIAATLHAVALQVKNLSDELDVDLDELDT